LDLGGKLMGALGAMWNWRGPWLHIMVWPGPHGSGRFGAMLLEPAEEIGTNVPAARDHDVWEGRVVKSEKVNITYERVLDDRSIIGRHGWDEPPRPSRAVFEVQGGESWSDLAGLV
jgi:hypothetical protein